MRLRWSQRHLLKRLWWDFLANSKHGLALVNAYAAYRVMNPLQGKALSDAEAVALLRKAKDDPRAGPLPGRFGPDAYRPGDRLY